MKFSIKYFILVLSMVYAVMANCQYADVLVIKSYCKQNDAGSAKVRINIPSIMDLDWDQPPYTANIQNLDTDQEWETSLNIVEGNFLIGNVHNLTIGYYEVIIYVTDRCFLRLNFTIEPTETFETTIFESWSPTVCNQITKLIWYVNGQDPTGKYNFKWSNGTQASSITLQDPGTFTVKITNKNSGCEHVENFELVDHEFSFTDNVSQPSCETGGSVDLDVVPNTLGLPIRFNWSDGNTERVRLNLAPGQYCVTITSGYVGQRECKKTKCFTIIAPPFAVNSNIVQTNCSGLP